jgi:hypothetical protein
MKITVKRAVPFSVLLLLAAAYAFFQTDPPAPKPRLTALIPSGALLCLEAQNFGNLMHDWDASQAKAAWLKSGNYSVFSRSNLFTKLEDVYGQYGAAAGFLPGLKGITEIAGTESVLALYDIREVEFLYISRIGDAELMKSQLWAVRDKFQQRQAGGVSFFLRTDPVSKRTAAFAFAKGYLLLATRDDLVAQALELLAGGSGPNIASDRWDQDATAAAGKPGELRLVMNFESLVKSVYFRSYWVQRNVSTIRRYWTGVADASRAGDNITETRMFLRSPDAEPGPVPGSATVGNLLPLIPPDAGFYKAWTGGDSSAASELIVEKLIGRQSQKERNWRDAPYGISLENRAGSEADLEIRIDERPLPSGADISNSLAAVQPMVEKSAPRAVLLVQSTMTTSSFFIRMPSVIVMEGSESWDLNSVRNSLVTTVGGLWTTSQLGTRWIAGTAGRHAVERLDGLGGLVFANRGKLLFLSNDATLLAGLLDRAGTEPIPSAFTYAAGFRHALERSNYERIMQALDFNGYPEGLQTDHANNEPSFFSGNIASLSQVLSRVSEIRVTEDERATVTLQTVLYHVGQ